MDETRNDEKKQTAIRLLKGNKPLETIQLATDLSIDAIKAIAVSLGMPVTA